MNDNEKSPDDRLSPEAREYYKEIREKAPDKLTNLELVAALGNVLTAYARGPHHATEIIEHLHIATLAYYDSHPDILCDCPKCTEKRKKSVN